MSNNYKKKKVHINNPTQNVSTELTIEETEDIIVEENIENTEEAIPEVEENESFTFEEFNHMYRVRLDWNRHDTQIFASPDKDAALKEAENHEGYKVYIDDDGELFYDPWDPANIEMVEIPEKDNRFVIIPVEGSKIILENCPIYSTVYAKKPLRTVSGVFYYYDYSVTNGRAKITKVDIKNVYKKDPTMILGYIDVR